MARERRETSPTRQNHALAGSSWAMKILIVIVLAVNRNKYAKSAIALLVAAGFLISFCAQGTVTLSRTSVLSHSRRSKSEVISPVRPTVGHLQLTVANTTAIKPKIPVNKTVHAKPKRRKARATPQKRLKPRKRAKSRKDIKKIDTNKQRYPPIDLEKKVPNLDELFNRTLIITAVSKNHVAELEKMVATVQRQMPNMGIIAYDLGLTKKARDTILRMCNVKEVRNFDYTKYPPHLKNLLNYAWKPAIIKETLYEFGAIFWADTSIRFKRSIRPLYQFIKKFHGYIPMVTNYKTTDYKFSNYNKTHPDMYKYLGVDLESYLNDRGYTPAVNGGRLLFVNSSYMNEKLLQPWVDCAMALECIAPKGSQNPHAKRIRGYHVHRYDQSALGVLMYKNLRGLFRKGSDAARLFGSISAVQNNNRNKFKIVNNITFCD